MSDALKELFPRKIRLSVYLATSLALMVLTAIIAYDGNWVEAITSFLGALVPLLAAANLTPEELEEVPGPVQIRMLVYDALVEYGAIQPGISEGE